MSIREKCASPMAQGYSDYTRGYNECPFEDGSLDAHEWELGWMESRRDGTRGEAPVGGAAVRHWSSLDGVLPQAIGATVGDEINIVYKNHKGITAPRRIRVKAPAYVGTTQYYPKSQWLLRAIDIDRGEDRTFAIANILSWDEVTCKTL